MDAEERRITIDRYEWALKSPAHHTELEKAVAVAEKKRAELAAKRTCTGDVHVTASDNEVIVSFEAERPKTATRGHEAKNA
ncbi:hypothetical protein ABZX56_11050 [Streptomyces parvulus]|uniref:hypothetical protein n=1 Tax=Streptomyces parvulus TaxID=146923 RepID=UPI0033A28480